MSSYYIAASYARMPEVRSLAEKLTAQFTETEIVSVWHLYDTPDVSSEQMNEDPSAGALFAYQDLRSCNFADVFIMFTGDSQSRGGRHVEFGYWVTLRKSQDRTVIIGPRENVFHCLDNIEVYPDIETFLTQEHLRA